MNTSPYPRLDGITDRLRWLPEVSALLEYGYNGEPPIQPPSISVPGLTDAGLIVRWEAHIAAFFRRLSYVAGGSRVTVHARDAIRASLTAADVKAIEAECANTSELDEPDPATREMAVNFVMERLLLSDEQFHRGMELDMAIRKHVRDKGL